MLGWAGLRRGGGRLEPVLNAVEVYSVARALGKGEVAS